MSKGRATKTAKAKKQPKSKQQSPKTVEEVIGRRVRLIGNHPWAGESAEVVGFDNLGMRVKLLRMDAMYGHECYVMSPREFREEKKGLDW